MNLDKTKRRAVHSWLFVAALVFLCGVLGVLQYRWTGEVSLAERDRLRGSLQATLIRLSQDFNSEIATAVRAMLPGPASQSEPAENEFAARYEHWKKSTRHGQILRAIAIAAPRNGALVLRSLNLESGEFTTAEWPETWNGIRERLEFLLSAEPWQNRGRPPRAEEEQGSAFVIPVLRMQEPAAAPFDRRETEYAIFDLNLAYVRDAVLPELLQRHLGAGTRSDYQVEVVTRTRPQVVVYQSDPGQPKGIGDSADATVALFEVRFEQMRRWGVGRDRAPERGPGPGFLRFGPGPGFGRPGGPGLAGAGFGRWEMRVRHRAGSLEAVVSRARWRNLAVSSGVLLLILASAAALLRFTRRAQRLAELQMDFVAGVSHELRTPLTVIHTAAYNLQGKLANNPSQVERYGSLIQQESGRLKELVEQILHFAGAEAGRVIREREPLSVETVIADTLESSKPFLQAAKCVVETKIDPGLPPIEGDAVALKQALQNLLSNAAKYGTGESNWIGITASKAGEAVEIRVADRGSGIPEDEQDQIFDPFFRGRRARQDQVHGTGLGLNLVKKIVEAHGGSIRLKSEPMKGCEFTLRIPAPPAGA